MERLFTQYDDRYYNTAKETALFFLAIERFGKRRADRTLEDACTEQYGSL